MSPRISWVTTSFQIPIYRPGGKNLLWTLPTQIPTLALLKELETLGNT